MFKNLKSFTALSNREFFLQLSRFEPHKKSQFCDISHIFLLFGRSFIIAVMSNSDAHKPGKRLGQGMLFVSFALGLGVLTFFFDGWLQNEANPNRDPQYFESVSGIREVVLQGNRQGHYVANGYINNVEVTFLLDTGATDVAIPEPIARRAGLVAGYQGQAATANGIVTVYATRIDELRLGNIVLRDIPASITPSFTGETILLGMSALRQVEFTQRNDILTLRQMSEFD